MAARVRKQKPFYLVLIKHNMHMLAAYKIWPVATQIPGILDPYTPPTDII